MPSYSQTSPDPGLPLALPLAPTFSLREAGSLSASLPSPIAAVAICPSGAGAKTRNPMCRWAIPAHLFLRKGAIPSPHQMQCMKGGKHNLQAQETKEVRDHAPGSPVHAFPGRGVCNKLVRTPLRHPVASGKCQDSTFEIDSLFEISILFLVHHLHPGTCIFDNQSSCFV